MSPLDLEKGEIPRDPTDLGSFPPEPTSAKSSWTISRLSSISFGPLLSNKTSDDSENARRSKSWWQWRRGKPSTAVSQSDADKVEIARKAFVEPRVRSLMTAPKGYPRLATFLDSDEQFMMFRRFGFVQTRILLEKQDDLRLLEAKLDKLDKEMEARDEMMLLSRDIDDEDDLAIRRQKLLPRLEKTFCEYANLIDAAGKLVSLNHPAPADYRSVLNYMADRKPVVADERSWIKDKEDLITLRPGREHAWLDAGIEHLLRWLHCPPLRYLFCSKETQQKGDGIGAWYTRSRIDRLVISIITIFILILLVVPIFILYHLVDSVGTNKTDSICIGVLLVFTLAFSAVLSLFTRAKRHEILGAAAAYCAVLVVFLGNVPDHQS